MEAVLHGFEYSTSTSVDLGYEAFKKYRAYLPPNEIDPGIAIALKAVGDAVAGAVSATTRRNASQLVRFGSKQGLGAPEITFDVAGEIALEWYRDRNHFVAFTADTRNNVRWLAVNGAANPVSSGVQRLESDMPAVVLNAINNLI